MIWLWDGCSSGFHLSRNRIRPKQLKVTKLKVYSSQILKTSCFSQSLFFISWFVFLQTNMLILSETAPPGCELMQLYRFTESQTNTRVYRRTVQRLILRDIMKRSVDHVFGSSHIFYRHVCSLLMSQHPGEWDLTKLGHNHRRQTVCTESEKQVDL